MHARGLRPEGRLCGRLRRRQRNELGQRFGLADCVRLRCGFGVDDRLRLGLRDDPFGGFDCSDDFEFRLYLGLPAEVIENADPDMGYSFGSEEDGTGGAPEHELSSWLQVGTASDCATGSTPDETGLLYIEAVNSSTLEVEGRICNYYWTPELSYGLSGTFATAASCSG